MKTNKLLIGAALAGLSLSTLTACPTPEAQASGQCHGVNGCKGQGACGGKDHDCGGKNACKGQGWVKSTAEECTTKGGQYVAPSK